MTDPQPTTATTPAETAVETVVEHESPIPTFADRVEDVRGTPIATSCRSCSRSAT